MTLYEYKCRTCGAYQDEFHKMGHAARSTLCKACGQTAHRVFMIGCVKTDRNNPLRKFGRQLGARMETRRSSDRLFKERGLVMASERDCDAAERDNWAEQRQLDKIVDDTVAEYRKLPAALLKADAVKVAQEEAARGKRATAQPMQ